MSLSKPVTREELKQYILTRLGSPVIEINIADEQVDIAIQDAFDFFGEYSVDGMENTFIAHQITQTDIDNRYIPVPVNVTGVNKVFRPRNRSFGLTGDNLFNIEYYLYRNEIFELAQSGGGLSSYYITMQQIALMDDILNFNLHYRFSTPTNRLYIDTDWVRNFPVGSFLAFEAYQKLDPEEYPELYNNWVIRDLSTALAKRQWGANLSKYEQIQLPGGVTLNGTTLYEQAELEIDRIKTDFIQKFQEPPEMYVG